MRRDSRAYARIVQGMDKYTLLGLVAGEAWWFRWHLSFDNIEQHFLFSSPCHGQGTLPRCQQRTDYGFRFATFFLQY